MLEREREGRGLGSIVTRHADLDEDPLPVDRVDAVWCRWVLAFVKHPKAVVEMIAKRLEPGGIRVAHEYGNYATWRLLPRLAAFEGFVEIVIAAWRADGGEPDVGTELPTWLEASGFEIISLDPILDVVAPQDERWHWLEAFVRVGLERLATLGRLSPAQAGEILREFERHKARPGIRCVTPLVLETIAIKRG